MGQLKAGETVTLDSGAVVSNVSTVDFGLSFSVTGNEVVVCD